MSSNFGPSALSRVFQQSSSGVRRRVIGIYAFLITYNLVAWLLALVIFYYAKLLLIAFTAYTFGLRHAFDPDHISAIDNVTPNVCRRSSGLSASASSSLLGTRPSW